MSMQFKKATKSQARARIALIGPSGSGKTYTALALGTHLGARVAVIDTERGSASKYAGEFEFDVLELEDFNPQSYVDAIRAATVAGFDVLIIDSLSHAWMGAGGALELVDKAAKKSQSGNSFAAWREVTPLHNKLVDAILRSDCHVIATIRSKTDYVQEKDDRGRTQVRRVGLAPVQRDGLEYEFDIVADLDIEHNLIISKTRCRALDGMVAKCAGEREAGLISAWLTDGRAPTEGEVRARIIAQCGDMFREMNAQGYQPKWNAVTIKTYVNDKYMVANGMEAITVAQLQDLAKDISSKLDALIARNEQEAGGGANEDAPPLKRAS